MTNDERYIAFACAALSGLLAQTEVTESGYPCPVWQGDRGDREGLASRSLSVADAMEAEYQQRRKEPTE